MLDGTDELGALIQAGAIEPDAVADALAEAIAEDRFLVLPHPEVADYYGFRASDTDAWLTGMNKLQRRLEQA
jgi:hypothetical protein